MFADFPLALSYDDVLLVPQHSELNSRSEVDLSTQITPHVKIKIPIISINMDTVTGVDMAIALGKLGGLSFLPRFDGNGAQANMVSAIKKAGVTTAAAIGVRNGYLERAEALANAGCDILTIDVAHGHMQQVIDAIKVLKSRFPNIDLITGAIATYEASRDLLLAGADSVRVGVGPGTICTTRIVTGFGVPQITAVLEATRAARELGKTVLCDGGTNNSGDIVKGLAAGAHAVVMGSQLAGTDEAPGDMVIHQGAQYKKYNGSTSLEEKQKQIKKIGNEVGSNYVDYIEGVSALVPYKGSVEKVINRLLAGIRSGYSYAGAKNIDELHNRAQFVRISSQGLRESRAHDVIVTN